MMNIDTRTDRPRRIVAEGRVELGRELKLKQSQAPADATTNGVPMRNWMGQRIDYRLAAASGAPPAIVDDGLVNGFGIFGAPGTGKTHLLMHILEQILCIQPDATKKFGGLILDPKAALLEDIVKMWSRLPRHRQNDLIVLKPDFLNALGPSPGFDSQDGSLHRLPVDLSRHPRGLNVIDCALSPTELGRLLVLAAQAAGVSAREPFWFLAWTNLFGAALTLLEYQETYMPTLRLLLDSILLTDPSGDEVPNVWKGGAAGTRRERYIETLARRAREAPERLVENGRRLGLTETQILSDLLSASAQIASFFESDYVRTVEAFVVNAFGSFQQERFARLSRRPRRMTQKYGTARGKVSLYDQIIEEGKVVLVSMGPEDPGMGKVLCTLVKCLFQQSVMSRLERFDAGKLSNFTRPVFIACDEYAEVASEVPGQPIGDGRFFSLARQNGCMGLLATQSIHTLQNSSLSDSWKSIFSNLTGKIFMGAADHETAEQACALAGQIDWEMTSTTESFGKDNAFSHQRSFQARPELTPYILTHVLKRGQAVALGSLDGRATPPSMRFIQVPNRGAGAAVASPESVMEEATR
jgi:hypothetical protein